MKTSSRSFVAILILARRSSPVPTAIVTRRLAEAADARAAPGAPAVRRRMPKRKDRVC